MDEDGTPQQPELGLHSVADKLREARETQNLSVEDIAAKTRIPLRHLIAIEESRYDALPGKTYAMGFAKSYARAVNLDEVKIGQELRTELGDRGAQYGAGEDAYEPVSSARIPTRALALTTAAIALMLIVGYVVWRSSVVGDSASETPIAASPDSIDDTDTASVAEPSAAATPASAAVAPDAPIVIKASSEVWMGFNDPAANGRLVFERTFKAGETYAVPAEARAWTMRTSRPQAIEISVGGKVMPQMGKPDLLVKDIPLNAAALVAKAATMSANGVTGAPVDGAANGGSSAPALNGISAPRP